MKIKCRTCGHSEKTSLGFFVKLIGGAMPIGGFWAWVAYLFAGTEFALPIVIAIIGGGTAMLMFKDEIVQWITNRGYICPKCGDVNWEVFSLQCNAKLNFNGLYVVISKTGLAGVNSHNKLNGNF